MGVLPKPGAIVASTIDFDSINEGDFGLVEGPADTSDPRRVSVAFAERKVNLAASHMVEKKNLSKGKFVCAGVSHNSVKVGDIGCVVGVSTSVNRNRVLVDFGQYGHISKCLNLSERQILDAPAVWGRVGDTVYSLIDFAHFKKGDRGILVGPSSDREAKDRVAVRFGIVPQAFNLGEDMVSLEDPLAEDEDDSLASAFWNPTDYSQAAPSDTLRTEDVTLISHAHGRARRAERNIQRRELQAAIKYGVRESANPGRDGSQRWRYTYDGVVYITDETSRHEVTSWRIDGEDAEAVAPAEIELAGKGCHAVLVVDSSGSMRAPDVPGYRSRAGAVYECLVRDFVKEQVKTGAGEDVVVTLISMSDDATVLIDKHPLDGALVKHIEGIKRRQPRSHGNYIPALDKALEVMTEDAPNRASMLLLFFSDGAPSDQREMVCEHGVSVFQVDRRDDPLMGHTTKGSAWACRRSLHDKVKFQCLDRVKRIGQVFGRDKVILRTLAFGPPKEDFRMLEELASALPRGEFQKLGLDASNLKTAFSSLSSSMTELRTEGGGRLLTPRRDKVVDKQQKLDVSSSILKGSEGWWIYSFSDFIGKYCFDNSSNGLKKSPLSLFATGLAFFEQPFAEGAERFVFRCTEIRIPENMANDWYGSMDSAKAARCGLRLVAKEAKDVENLHRGRKFHETFARVQNDAAALAIEFNLSLPSRRAEWNVSFLQTAIYGCIDSKYKDNEAWVLVEPEMDGQFMKWNNNAGAVRGHTTSKVKTGPSSGDVGTLGIEFMTLLEEEDEDVDEEDSAPIETDDVPQAFSHFSYEHSKGRQLVCDLQGVWNPDDGFVLTDPVVHYVCPRGKRHKNGATDKGSRGVKRFFETHKCNTLCRKMGLPARSADDLILVPPKNN